MKILSVVETMSGSHGRPTRSIKKSSIGYK